MTWRTLILMIGLFPALANAGAWTQKQGALQLIQTNSVYRSDDYYDTNGQKQSQQRYQKYEISGYAEYGWRDNITLGGQLALVHATQSPFRNLAPGDGELFARLRLWQDDSSVVSLQPYLVIPLNLSSAAQPKIGTDDYGVGLRPSYGKNITLFGTKGYIDIAPSYLHRRGRASDQLKLDLTSEAQLTPSWSVMPQLFLTRSRGDLGRTQFTQSAADDYHLAKIQLSALLRITPRNKVQLGAFHHLAGKNTGHGSGLLLAYWLDY